MADFDKECYYTYDKDYVKNQIQQFYKLYNKVNLYLVFQTIFHLFIKVVNLKKNFRDLFIGI